MVKKNVVLSVMDGWWINAVGDQKIKKKRKILEMKNTKKKGFTLVELVIVIAVIAILAAVLIPTFTSVITRANQSKAVQEWKAAVDEAYVEYVADYHEVPTTVKVDGKTIEFGNEKTYTDDRFVEGFVKLASGYIELDKDQKVYFNWTGSESGSTYAVATTSEGDELTTPANPKTYKEAMTEAAKTAFNNLSGKTEGTTYIVISGSYAFVVNGTSWPSSDPIAQSFTLGETLVVDEITYNLVSGENWPTESGTYAKRVATGIYETKTVTYP